MTNNLLLKICLVNPRFSLKKQVFVKFINKHNQRNNNTWIKKYLNRIFKNPIITIKPNPINYTKQQNYTY
jgi:hypothetical protein